MSKGNTSTTWLSEALKEIQINDNLNDELCDVLRAFGKEDDDAPGPSNLDPDAMNITADALQTRITKELLDEIDEDQARMFGRRFSSVSTLLLEEKEGDAAATKDGNQVVTTTKQLLRLALHRRTVQILSTNDPILSQRKALRIRALVDFIWSQSSKLLEYICEKLPRWTALIFAGISFLLSFTINMEFATVRYLAKETQHWFN